jgi:hypothetical protein
MREIKTYDDHTSEELYISLLLKVFGNLKQKGLSLFLSRVTKWYSESQRAQIPNEGIQISQ